jgi:TPP-dependent pyruvate/acetoin dehydrogenase alpha subunit
LSKNSELPRKKDHESYRQQAKFPESERQQNCIENLKKKIKKKNQLKKKKQLQIKKIKEQQ